MSAVFPHDAVVQRYLHTGTRRSHRKVVVPSVFGVLACVVVAAALPARAPKSEVDQSVTSEQIKAAQPAVQDVASRPAPPTTQPNVDVAASAATTGAAAIQLNAMPAPSPAVAAPAPPPVVQAAIVPPPATTPVTSATPDHAADISASKRVATKLNRKAGHALTAAEKRNRAARLRAPQPTLVRVYDLPDGRRIYQRVTGNEARLGYPGGEIRRVYLAPADRSVD